MFKTAKIVILALLLSNVSFAQDAAFDSIMADKSLHDTIRIKRAIDYGIKAKNVSFEKALKAFCYADSLAKLKANQHVYFKELQADATRNKAVLYMQVGNYVDAIAQFKIVVTMFSELGNDINKADNLNIIGVIYAGQAQYDEALSYFKKFLEAGQSLNDKQVIAKAHNNFGMIYWNQGIYDKAIDEFHTALRLNEELGNKSIMSGNYNNIGNIHKQQGNLAKALEYYKKSLEIALELDMKQQISGCYNNIGVTIIGLNREHKNTDSIAYSINQAIQYYDRALAIAKNEWDLRCLSMTYNNIGSAYQAMANISKNQALVKQNLDSAIKNYTQSITMKKELGDKNGLSINHENISNLYLELAKVETISQPKGQAYLDSALYNAKQSMLIAQEIGSTSRQNEAAKALYNSYKAAGDYTKAIEYVEIYITTRDSLFSKEKTDALTEMETRYQTHKKEQEITKQQLLIEKHEYSRKALIIGIILIFALALAIGVGYLTKQRANQLINYKNRELEQANAEILAQRDEIESQRDMLQDQNMTLEEFQLHTTQSLRYAQSIQAAIIPSEKILQKISCDYFVMMKPCELVSGDFFWAATFNEYQVFCMTDCTGHGVPGAFMSILGISALDEIVNRHRVTKPSEILGYLRQSVIEALSQNDPEQLHKDGMDISLCVLNTKTRELQFAGAGQHLWMVIDENSNLKPKTDSKIISHNGHNLFEVKGDTMPVGQSPLNNPFVNHSISLADNAANIYLVTDGFADQLNDSRMKYGAKRLKTFILSHCDKPMADQNQILVREFENWMGSSYQVDDVTVMGIRLA